MTHNQNGEQHEDLLSAALNVAGLSGDLDSLQQQPVHATPPPPPQQLAQRVQVVQTPTGPRQVVLRQVPAGGGTVMARGGGGVQRIMVCPGQQRALAQGSPATGQTRFQTISSPIVTTTPQRFVQNPGGGIKVVQLVSVPRAGSRAAVNITPQTVRNQSPGQATVISSVGGQGTPLSVNTSGVMKTVRLPSTPGSTTSQIQYRMAPQTMQTMQKVVKTAENARSGSPVIIQTSSGAGARRITTPLTIQSTPHRSGSPMSLLRTLSATPSTSSGDGGGGGAMKMMIPAGLMQQPSTPLSGQKTVFTSGGGSGDNIRIITPGGTAAKALAHSQGMHLSASSPGPLTDKAVSRLWTNEDMNLKRMQQQVSLKSQAAMIMEELSNPGSPGLPGTSMQGLGGQEEVYEEEEEELGHAETYNEYMPPKLRIGIRHPDQVVETSSLASVEPPDVTYTLAIPEKIMDNGFLSALQLESITYTCQKHSTLLPSGHRAGYLIGDGAGVGKGRTVAGIIYENYLQGRKRSLWLSVSNDLKIDAERDLRDIGANKIEVHGLNKFKYAKISSHVNGSVKRGVIFATYSSLIGESQSGGKYRTRFKQLVHWLGKDFDGVIVFDECHRAKNLSPVGAGKSTKTGLTVLQLQNKLPLARIVYASATGASEPRNMAYMTRLGLWGPGTPFHEFNEFIQAVEKRGVGAMELVAMDMKLRGQYIARQLSFKGVSFKIEEVQLNSSFQKLYDDAVKLWVEARDKFQVASELMDADQRSKKTMWGQFWSAHQRFFKYLCISAKVPFCVKVARNAVKEGKCVVIGLQSTGEARTLEQLEDAGEINDFVSTAKGVIQSLVEKHFPAPDRKKTWGFLGLGGIFDTNSPSSSPNNKRKRKSKKLANSSAKRMKEDWTDESDSDSSFDSVKVAPKKEEKSESSLKPPSLSSDSDDSDNDSDSDTSNDRDEADSFNPFADSDDDDPWTKSTKTVKAKAKSKKKGKEKEEKKSEEKEKKKKEKKSKRRRSVSSDSEFDDIDDQTDKALQAVGLRSSKENSIGPISSARNSLKEGTDAVEQAIQLKCELLNNIEKLGNRLPPNTLDELIDSLGGTDSVSEMTGRKGRVVQADDGTIHYESRSEFDIPLETMNLTEKQRFMDGEKLIAVISEAASSGISLQADRRVKNHRRRVHITLELPWSADRAIQQFGRTHRSNQVSAPEYMFLISELAGERRFASTVAKRLESLGALTHGDRRATESRDLSRFNIDNKFGRTALEFVMKSVLELDAPLVAPPASYNGDFFKDVRHGLIGVGMISWDDKRGMASLEKDYNNISKFLNRLLGMEVKVQNALFEYFNETLAAVILEAKRNGRWDMGILDLGKHGEAVKKLETKLFIGTFSGATTKIELHTLSVERGMSWDEVMDIWHDHTAPNDGFYIASEMRNGKRVVQLAVMITGKNRERLYNIYKPNSGLQARPESLDDLKQRSRKVTVDEAKPYWEDQYYYSSQQCTHMYLRGNCKRRALGLGCEVGLRTRTYYVLSGSVLSVWTKVEQVLASVPGGYASRMQIIRMQTQEGDKIIGTLIPGTALQQLSNVLSAASDSTTTQQHGTAQGEHNAAANALTNPLPPPPPLPKSNSVTPMQATFGSKMGLSSGAAVPLNRLNHTTDKKLHSSMSSPALLGNSSGSFSKLYSQNSTPSPSPPGSYKYQPGSNDSLTPLGLRAALLSRTGTSNGSSSQTPSPSRSGEVTSHISAPSTHVQTVKKEVKEEPQEQMECKQEIKKEEIPVEEEDFLSMPTFF